ncbi:hypothetical protein GCM10009665_62860 [Kitasatospora nipponensis]|uniref:Tetratricopeptide repeat protein n=1 Tax=Kitasatospora nipponensis TaxID=258049 RepID=A0ABP4HKT8_9ACTN
MGQVDRIERARQLCDQAVFGGVDEALLTADQELDGAEADLLLTRGRVLHARFLADRHSESPGSVAPELIARELAMFERAVELFHRVGDLRGEGEALFWVGIFHQVVQGDGGTALPYFEKAYAAAEAFGDRLTLSYAARHLGFFEQEAGRTAQARARLEESVRLREEIDFRAGVAAGKLALAGLAAEEGDHAAAALLLDEADAVAESCGAHGVRRWIAHARIELASAS